MVSVSASHTVNHEFASRPGHTKDHHNKLSSYSVLRKVLKKLWIKKNSTPPQIILNA